MKRPVVLPALAALTTCLACAQNIAGDWQGTLKPPGAELRVVLHIVKDGGGFKASLDSVDQGANGIPVTSITLQDSKLNFTITSMSASYEGKSSADASLIEGSLSQGGASFPLEFKRQTAPIKTEHKPAKPSDVDGAWLGSVDVGPLKLRAVMHFLNTEDGLTAKLDFPDKNMSDMPATSVARNGSSISVEAKAVGGKFEGKFSADLNTLEGDWSQAGQSRPLVLKRVADTDPLGRRRPQDSL